MMIQLMVQMMIQNDDTTDGTK